MIKPIVVAELPAPVQRVLQGPPKMQEMAAKGVVIGIAPGDVVLLLVALTQGAEPAIADQANRTLGNLPAQVLQGALGSPLAPIAIHALATRYHAQTEILDKLVGLPQIDPDTVLEVAKVGNELTCELIATNEQRLLATPELIEALYLNKHCRMSTADRILELAVRNNVEVNLPAWKEAAAAILQELIPERSAEANPDDAIFARNLSVAEAMRQEGEEIEDAIEDDDEAPQGGARVKEKFVPLYREIALMTNSQKIRFASIGTPEAILILVSDPSPLVSLAAAKSPNINEAIVEKIAKRRNISGEVLTAFGQRPELLRRLSTKRDLMKNPKTPPSLALKLINFFQAHELERMQNDRNVAGSVRQLIRNHLERKKR